jgi:hypothetical protein
MAKKINESRAKRRGPEPLDDPRDHCVSSRLNDAELAQLDRQRGSLARGEYLRCAALDELPPTIPAINREAWVELSKAAGNLNQIAKRLNEERGISESQFEKVVSELREFRSALIGAKLK